MFHLIGLIDDVDGIIGLRGSPEDLVNTNPEFPFETADISESQEIRFPDVDMCSLIVRGVETQEWSEGEAMAGLVFEKDGGFECQTVVMGFLLRIKWFGRIYPRLKGHRSPSVGCPFTRRICIPR